jgi:hypothetical protein
MGLEGSTPEILRLARDTDHGKQLGALLDGPPSIRYFNPLDV